MGTKVHEGAFFGKSVRLVPGMTLRHRPMPWLVQTVSVTPAQVCPGQSFEVAAQTGNVGLPNDSVKVLIDRVPVTRYVDQLSGNPGPREITVVAKASGGLIDSQVATVELVACPNSGPFPQLVFEENILEQDSIHVSVLNAADFEDGTQRYTFDFGDGDVVESSFPSVTHDYTDSFRRGRGIPGVSDQGHRPAYGTRGCPGFAHRARLEHLRRDQEAWLH